MGRPTIWYQACAALTLVVWQQITNLSGIRYKVTSTPKLFSLDETDMDTILAPLSQVRNPS